MDIFSRIIPGAKPNILLLHGLYSSSSNWYPVARDLGYQITLLDLPNHGRSVWCDTFSYRSIADTLRNLITEPTVIVGHSFGGRVAMMLARECPNVVGLVVVDISPVSNMKIDRAFTLCHAMFLQHLLAASRQKVTDIEGYLHEKGVAPDMCSAVDQAYRQMNIEVIANNIMKLPTEWNRINSEYGVSDIPTLFVRGGASPYIQDSYIEEFHNYYSNFSVATVQDATHRLHHEKPEEFVRIIKQFIENGLSNGSK